MVGYVKHNFFERYRAFESLEHLNRLLEGWLAEVADRRCHGTVKEIVAERFEGERAYLQDLPPVRFDTSYRETRRVALDAFVDVRANRYSVPGHLCGQTVAVHIGLDERIKIYDADGELAAEHRLRPATAGWQVVPSHHARLWRETFQVQTRDLRCYEEARPWS